MIPITLMPITNTMDKLELFKQYHSTRLQINQLVYDGLKNYNALNKTDYQYKSDWDMRYDGEKYSIVFNYQHHGGILIIDIEYFTDFDALVNKMKLEKLQKDIDYLNEQQNTITNRLIELIRERDSIKC